jgi:hypothetical protein
MILPCFLNRLYPRIGRRNVMNYIEPKQTDDKRESAMGWG